MPVFSTMQYCEMCMADPVCRDCLSVFLACVLRSDPLFRCSSAGTPSSSWYGCDLTGARIARVRIRIRTCAVPFFEARWALVGLKGRLFPFPLYFWGCGAWFIASTVTETTGTETSDYSHTFHWHPPYSELSAPPASLHETLPPAHPPPSHHLSATNSQP